MENEASANQTTNLPSAAAKGAGGSDGSTTSIRQLSTNDKSLTSNTDTERLSQTALLSGCPEIESRSGVPLSFQMRAHSNATSLFFAFASVSDILTFLQSGSPDVIEAYKVFCKDWTDVQPQFAAKLRALADELDSLSKGEAAQRRTSPAGKH
jgi:hypothetical protein